MSSEFKNIQRINADGANLWVNPLPLYVFGEKEIPIGVSFQIGNQNALISLDDFCAMFEIYLVHGGLAGWESLPCGIPDHVRKVLEAAAKKIGR